MNRQRTVSTPLIKIRTLCALMLMGGVTSVYGIDDVAQSDSISARGNPLTPAEDPLPLKFYDDFSTPAGYLVYDAREEGVSLVDMEDGPLTITTASDDDKDDRSSPELLVFGRSDSLSVGLSLSSDTSMPNVAGFDARSEVKLSGWFYNEIADGGEDELGDVTVDAGIKMDLDDSRYVEFCVGREDENAVEELLLFDNGTESCTQFNDFEPELDTVYQLSVTLDREAKTLTFGLDDLTETVNIESDIYIPYMDSKKIQVRNRGDAGFTVGKIHNISTSLFSLDFEAHEVAIAPYESYRSTELVGNEIEFSDGKAQLMASSELGSRQSVKIRTLGEHDYIEATINVSSDSGIGATGKVKGRVAGVFYNDTQDGGSGVAGQYDGDYDATGDVFVELSLDFFNDGNSVTRVCAWRSNDASFSDSDVLISGADGSECEQLSVTAEFDTDYRMSIELDKNSGVVNCTVGEETFVFTPVSQIFSPANHWKRVELRAEEDSIVIGTIDDLKTSARAVSLLESGNAIGRDAPENPDTQDSAVSENSSGGGCSMVKGSNDSMMLILLFIAICGFLVRRKKHGM